VQENGGHVITLFPMLKACNDGESKTSGIANASGMQFAILNMKTVKHNANIANLNLLLLIKGVLPFTI
jgi:hypothetical protein